MHPAYSKTTKGCSLCFLNLYPDRSTDPYYTALRHEHRPGNDISFEATKLLLRFNRLRYHIFTICDPMTLPTFAPP